MTRNSFIFNFRFGIVSCLGDVLWKSCFYFCVSVNGIFITTKITFAVNFKWVRLASCHTRETWRWNVTSRWRHKQREGRKATFFDKFVQILAKTIGLDFTQTQSFDEMSLIASMRSQRLGFVSWSSHKFHCYFEWHRIHDFENLHACSLFSIGQMNIIQ